MLQLSIRSSNRLEVLVEHLAAALADQSLPPLEDELVLVQSQGMARWLQLELARRHGVSAALDCPFPASWLYRLAETVVPGAERIVGYDQVQLGWLVFSLLEDRDPSLAPLEPYLAGDHDGRRRFQLAHRIAGRFADYQLYRPQLIRAWEAGQTGSQHPDAGWQAALWRRVVQVLGISPSRRLDQLQALVAAASPPAGLPSRLAVFGIASLPPRFLELVAALSRHVPVTLYLCSPTWGYWGDIRSEREQARLRRRQARPGSSAALLHLETGNPLLAELGRQGRELFELIQRLDTTGQAQDDLEFLATDRQDALGVLQDDVLDLVDRGRDPDAPVLALAPDDHSLRIHSCHSPGREVEILHDQLVQAFADDPTLTPDQVLVLVPDIARYAPYVAAVFGSHSDRPALPVSIADRGLAEDAPILHALLAPFTLRHERYAAPAVLDWLEQPAVARRFELDPEDLARIRGWIQRTGIRWGLDQRALDGVASDHSWLGGIDRLLAGYALGGEDPTAELLPVGGDTTTEGEVAGRLWTAIEALRRAEDQLAQPLPPAQWQAVLLELAQRLVAPTEDAELQALERWRLAAGQIGSGLRSEERAIPPAAVREHLELVLAGDGLGGGFIGGAITVGALRPMRSIPFRVIAVLGLDDVQFPRRDHAPAFDLVAAEPQLGDRRSRDDDRYLFLETLLAARSRLILSHVGRSQRDNQPLPPSTCLLAICGQLERSFGSEAVAALSVVHPLQPFSPRYYSAQEPELFSYSAANQPPAATDTPPQTRAFADAALPVATDQPIELEDLLAFWRHPARAWLRRLGISLWRDQDRLPASEAFALDLRERPALVEDAARHGPAALRLATADAQLPQGIFGEILHQPIARTGADLAAAASAQRQQLAIDLALDGHRIVGRLDGPSDGIVLRWRGGKLRDQDSLELWLRLLLSAAAGGPRRGQLVHANGCLELTAPADPRPVLVDLCTRLRAGQARPLAYFHGLARIIAEAGTIDETNRGKLRSCWSNPHWSDQFGSPPEDRDPAIALCWRGIAPLDHCREDLIEHALAVWTPLRAAVVAGKL